MTGWLGRAPLGESTDAYLLLDTSPFCHNILYNNVCYFTAKLNQQNICSNLIETCANLLNVFGQTLC